MRHRWSLPENGPRRWMSIVAVNLVVLAVLVGLLEIVSSFYVTWPRGNRVPHPILHHTWKPNSSFVHREWIAHNPDFPEPYTHTYNAQGWLEDYDVVREKDSDVFRVYYLGDSFTEGTAPMDGSMPSLVEAELNRLGAATGQRFEVINAGTSSHSPTIHYINMRYVLLEYDPDLIVINVDMTDAHDDWLYSKSLETDADGNPAAVRPALSYRIEQFLYNHSYTYHYARMVGRWLRDSREPAEATSDPGWFDWCEEEEWSERTAVNAARTLDIMRRITSLARESGVRVMFSSVPHYEQFAGGPEGGGEPTWSIRPHHVMGEAARELSVPYLNAYEALEPLIGGSPQTRYYYAGDMHFNPRGYRIWADAQIEFLTDPANDLLPEAMYPATAESVGPQSD